MGFQEIIVLIQTVISAISLVVSLIALSTANSVKKKVEKNSHIKKKSSQVAIGSKNEQRIEN